MASRWLVCAAASAESRPGTPLPAPGQRRNAPSVNKALLRVTGAFPALDIERGMANPSSIRRVFREAETALIADDVVRWTSASRARSLGEARIGLFGRPDNQKFGSGVVVLHVQAASGTKSPVACRARWPCLSVEAVAGRDPSSWSCSAQVWRTSSTGAGSRCSRVEPAEDPPGRSR